VANFSWLGDRGLFNVLTELKRDRTNSGASRLCHLHSG
jgi:hypothetical protein